MEIPKNEAEARLHIAEIRKAKRLDIDGPNGNNSDLENALIM
jgi:hypothetical protein